MCLLKCCCLCVSTGLYVSLVSVCIYSCLCVSTRVYVCLESRSTLMGRRPFSGNTRHPTQVTRVTATVCCSASRDMSERAPVRDMYYLGTSQLLAGIPHQLLGAFGKQPSVCRALLKRALHRASWLLPSEAPITLFHDYLASEASMTLCHDWLASDALITLCHHS